jgi:surfeit locus 1 family protein
MMGFRPRFWPTLVALVMIAIMISLGTWQVHRLAWKTELLATIAARMNGVAVPLPAAISDPSEWKFRHVHTEGHFAPDHALWLYGRTYDGKAGIHLLVPLIRPEGDAILIDRGFVPFEHGSELAGFEPAFDVPGQPTEVDGIVRQPEPGGLFVPSNQPDRNIWYSVDMPDMSKQLGIPLASIYLAEKAGGHPHSGVQFDWPAATGGTEGTGIPNDHRSYAIFWYSMAVVLAGIYVMSSLRRTPK